MAYDFQAVDPFGVETTGIECEGVTENLQRQDSVVNNNTGEPVAGVGGILGSVATFNNRKEVSASYKVSSVAGVAGEVVLGGAGTTVATQVQVTGNGGDGTAPAQISVSGHQNLSAADAAVAHDADSPEYTVTLPTAGLGVPTDPLGATITAPGTVTCIGFRWSASILNHKDKLDNAGHFLIGRSVGCRIECEADYMYTGSVAPVAGVTWKGSGSGAAQSNGDYSTITLRGFMYQAADA